MATSLSPSMYAGTPFLLILCMFCSLQSSSASKLTAAEVAAKCTRISTTASLKKEALDNNTLRVLVPWKVDSEEFVNFRTDSCVLDGFSIQVFLQALRHLQHPRPLRYRFVLHGEGDETPSYNDMIDMLANQEVDAVVADLTITRERMQKVGFTVPYLASSLVMVTPFRYGSAGTFWDFLKPFSKQLWLALLGCFAFTGLALYLLEDQNPEFAITSKKREGDSSHGGAASYSHGGAPRHPDHASSATPAGDSSPGGAASSCHGGGSATRSHVEAGSTAFPSPDHPPIHASSPALSATPAADEPPENPPTHADISSLQRPGLPIFDEASHTRRFMNAYWFTSLCVFQAQQESVRTHLGRIVTVCWLFVMLIFISSYTASLSSLLSAQKRYPTIESFQALLKDENIRVGYQEGSFMESYMKKLDMEGHKLKSFASEREYAQALRKGNLKPDGVGAVLDELPYVQILLQSECDFTKSSQDTDHLPSFGGFGFAFGKGDPLIDLMSNMILAMAEDGTLQVLQSGWRIGDDKRGRCNSNEDPVHLRLRSFGGLFLIAACVYVTCIIWRLSTKAIKSREGSCSALTRALPRGAQRSNSTIGRAGELSLGRRSNRVSDESHTDHVSS